MNNVIVHNAVRFVALLILQLFFMDQINFLGYINPMVYILFVLLFPLENNRWGFLLLAFLLGIIMDTFQDTGGAHAVATVTLAFIRPLLLKLVYGQGYLTKNLKIIQSPLDRFLLLLLLAIVVHHVLLFALVIFNTSQILYILKLTLSIGIASYIMITILFLLFSKRKEQ